MAKFNHTAHKELWDWLARNPDKEKKDWPGLGVNGGKYIGVLCYCFACEYDSIFMPFDCSHCPLVWPNNVICNDVLPDGSLSLYKKWDGETDLKKRSELARRIRDLPVREGVECE